MLNIELLYDQTALLLGIYPKEMRTYTHTKSCTQMFNSIVHNGLMVETIQISISGGIDKHSVTYPYNGKLFTIERNKVLIHATI